MKNKKPGKKKPSPKKEIKRPAHKKPRPRKQVEPKIPDLPPVPTEQIPITKETPIQSAQKEIPELSTDGAARLSELIGRPGQKIPKLEELFCRQNKTCWLQRLFNWFK